jgi:hypothetical protein
MKVIYEIIDCLDRYCIPDNNENILTDFHSQLLKDCLYAEIYFRENDEHHLGESRWICDIKMKNGRLLSIKLPKEMERNKVDDYFQPLLSYLKSHKFN